MNITKKQYDFKLEEDEEEPPSFTNAARIYLLTSKTDYTEPAIALETQEVNRLPSQEVQAVAYLGIKEAENLYRLLGNEILRIKKWRK